MRHVISKEEVCQAWVYQDRDYAHTQSRNLSFTNFDELISYSTPIASRLKTPLDKEMIFVTRHNYSVTTSKQLGELNSCLIGSYDPVIHVPYRVPTHTSALSGIWKAMIAEVQVLWAKASRARQRRDSLLAEGNSILQDANKIVDLFNLDVKDGIIIDKLGEMNELLRVHEAQIKLRA